jgi:phosphohistidine swiveling domain-containing protein
MGYSVPVGQPLMVMLAGQPFINVRLSFHSYIPRSTSSIISEKLVNHWVNKLIEFPEFHDKIEFKVAITTYSFDFDEKVEQLIGEVLTDVEKVEFKEAHRKQTISLLEKKGIGSIDQALDSINTLNFKHEELIKNGYQSKISSLFLMIDDCIQMGTIPFSILARHGFIAKTILTSLERCDIIKRGDISKIQSSIQTIAGDLVDDMKSLKIDELSIDHFMKKYGHLRPGTYDITSKRYDQMPIAMLSNNIALNNPKQGVKTFRFSPEQQKKINKFLKKEGFIDLNAKSLLEYINKATIGREYGKFVFTKTVSDVLKLIEIFAKKNGLSLEEVSHIPINSLLDVAKNSAEGSVEDRLRVISEHEAEKHSVSKAIRLPQLLTDRSGVYIIPFQVSHPNFITHEKITAQCLVLDTRIDKVSLEGKVVIIESADPGFDWIFSQKIAGLITKYGGVNSHMAIRCAEFGIPAAIGCGDQYFDLLLNSNRVHLNCAAGLINPLH